MKLKFVTLITAAVFSLSSCSMQTPAVETPENVTLSPVAITKAPASATILPSPAPTPAPTEELHYTLSLYDVPAYKGAAYIVLNNNVPGFTQSEMTTEPFEIYSPLDSFGRCGAAYANICREIMPTEKRGKIGQVKPSGWHTIRYDFIDGMYLYNRCHLIGYQLAGENANKQNLITGTQYLNVEGMLPFENMTADYVKATGHHVLYRATPVFVGTNLLALGVQLEAKSVEDSGAGLEFNVFCYNVQPGVGIDYATGDSWSDGSKEVHTPAPTQKPVAAAPAAGSSGGSGNATYILNTNTKKFHYPSCSSVSQMKDKNKREFTGSRDEAIAQGYSPCGRCHP